MPTSGREEAEVWTAEDLSPEDERSEVLAVRIPPSPQQRTREGIAARQTEEGYHHGPAPLGFEKADGHLVLAANYDQVVSRLDMIQSGNLSKRQAAKEPDTSRKSINRALERAELYGL